MMPALMFRREFLAVAAAAALMSQAAMAQSAMAQAARPKPKIGFIGAGKIGGQLAQFWARAGYPVMVSARDLGAMKELAAKIGSGAQAGTPAEAAAFGDVVVVSVPYGALPQVGRDYAQQLKGKVVLDTCNPNVRRDGDMTKDALEKGTGVVDPTYLPGTRLVRAFNTVGAGALAPNAGRQGELIGIPLASDDREALIIAAQMVRDAGFEPVIVGGLSTAKSFDTGTAVYGKALPASEVRAALNVKPAPADQ
ncbi:MAG TPA: NAD(P)-binding domain-containing protein [Rhizomicrobium sp.]|jgi:predicted dinucleotide-binding enzyme|nr:NAD(P)-binding domain-containing protein [Rhizomicrobium sp.]